MIDSLSLFKVVSIIFAFASVATGAMAIIDPIVFSNQFGLPLGKMVMHDDSRATTSLQHHRKLAKSYASLMGVRQLATGIVILLFAYQGKWIEVATILAIIGVLVAGTDGIYISRGGTRSAGQFHAIPGALIAALAGHVIYSNA